jgi:hypothetical protein
MSVADWARPFLRSLRRVAPKVAPASPGAVGAALSMLRPFDVGVPLMRVGGEGDGGYLVPDDLDGIQALFSPGVATSWAFEREMGLTFGIRSFMVDGSVEAPPGLTSHQRFDRLWLGSRSRGSTISLRDWVRRYAPDPSADLMLQMDIEGAEYEVLASTPRPTLRQFRVLVIEFHGLEWMGVAPILLWRIAPVWRKLAQDFRVVHVHPNNSGPLRDIGGLSVPNVVEVTYLRRDRGYPYPVSHAVLPHPLDRDCVATAPSVTLPPGWPNPPG